MSTSLDVYTPDTRLKSATDIVCPEEDWVVVAAPAIKKILTYTWDGITQIDEIDARDTERRIDKLAVCSNKLFGVSIESETMDVFHVNDLSFKYDTIDLDKPTGAIATDGIHVFVVSGRNIQVYDSNPPFSLVDEAYTKYNPSKLLVSGGVVYALTDRRGIEKFTWDGLDLVEDEIFSVPHMNGAKALFVKGTDLKIVTSEYHIVYDLNGVDTTEATHYLDREMKDYVDLDLEDPWDEYIASRKEPFDGPVVVQLGQDLAAKTYYGVVVVNTVIGRITHAVPIQSELALLVTEEGDTFVVTQDGDFIGVVL